MTRILVAQDHGGALLGGNEEKRCKILHYEYVGAES